MNHYMSLRAGNNRGSVALLSCRALRLVAVFFAVGAGSGVDLHNAWASEGQGGYVHPVYPKAFPPGRASHLRPGVPPFPKPEVAPFKRGGALPYGTPRIDGYRPNPVDGWRPPFPRGYSSGATGEADPLPTEELRRPKNGIHQYRGPAAGVPRVFDPGSWGVRPDTGMPRDFRPRVDRGWRRPPADGYRPSGGSDADPLPTEEMRRRGGSMQGHRPPGVGQQNIFDPGGWGIWPRPPRFAAPPVGMPYQGVGGKPPPAPPPGQPKGSGKQDPKGGGKTTPAPPSQPKGKQ